MTPIASSPAADMTIEEFFEKHYRPKRLRGASKHTINQFRCTFRAFDQHLGHTATLADLTDDNVAGFCWARIEAGKKHGTATKNTKNLLCLWRFAHRRRILQDWPEVEIPKEPERIPRALTEDELGRLFSVAMGLRGVIAGIPAAAWWTAIFRVIWDTGERIGAVMKLRWPDVDLSRKYLVSKAETRKWKRRDKGWSLADDTVAALRAIQQPTRDLVFPWDRFPTLIFQHFGRIAKAAGLPDTREFKFHSIRKSVASHFAARGGDATSLLDHSSASVTKLYIDPRVVKPVSACDLLFRVDAVPLDGPSVTSGAPGTGECVFVEINGCFHSIGKAQAAILTMLQAEPKGVEVHDLLDRLHSQGFSDPKIARPLTLLSKTLRAIFNLPESHEPVLRVKTGQKFKRDGWTVAEEIVSLNLPKGGAA